MNSFAADVMVPTVRAQLERLASEPWRSHPRACLIRAVRSLNSALSEDDAQNWFGDLVDLVALREGVASGDYPITSALAADMRAAIDKAVDQLMPEVA